MAVTKDNRMVDDWPVADNYRKSMRRKFSVYVSLAILAMMLGTGLIITDKYVDTVTHGVVETLLVQARSYSSPAGKHIISSDHPDALLLNNICKSLAADNRSVYWAAIADRNGAYLAHTEISRLVSGESLPNIITEQPMDMLRSGEQIVIRGDTIYTSVPIIQNDIELGRLGIASSAAPISAARVESIKTVVGITLVALLIGLPLTMVLMTRQLRPVSVITDSLKEANLEDMRIEIPFRSENEFGYLAETLEVMGAKLGMAQRHILEQDRIERELAIAHEIQANILPRGYPGSKDYQFAGVYKSAREIGGDYYDFIPIDDHRLGVLIADVSGKSLPGMLVMLMTRDIVRQARHLMLQPEKLLVQVNRELSTNIKKGMFVTMFFGVLDSGTATMKFASAGHNPLIRMDGTGRDLELLKTKGFPLGLMPPQPFEQRLEAGEVALEPNDWLIMYTDGINEAMDQSGREYGMERFLETLRSSSHRSPEELIEATLQEHSRFVGGAEQSDDITLMAMKWLGAGVRNRSSDKGESVNAHG